MADPALPLPEQVLQSPRFEGKEDEVSFPATSVERYLRRLQSHYCEAHFPYVDKILLTSSCIILLPPVALSS